MNQQVRVGLGILILNKNNELLLGQRISEHGLGSFGPPGGHLEIGESFENCAVREVKEETNLIISNPCFIGLSNDFFSETNKHYVSIFMKASYPEGQKITNMEPEKLLSWQWFALNNLPENLFLPLANFLSKKIYPA